MYDKSFRPKHVGISVADLDKAIHWYETVLGFKLRKREYNAGLRSQVAFMGNSGFEIELFMHDDSIALPQERCMPNEDIQTQGTKHLCLSCDNVFALANEFERMGVDIAFGPIGEPNHGMMFIRDNSGTLIEIVSE